MVDWADAATHAWSTSRSIEWLKTSASYALNTIKEKHRLTWTPAGTWHVETMPMEQKRPFRPRLFFREMHLWNGFLKTQAVDTFQLQHAQIRETRASQRTREIRREWQWRISLHLPTTQFGSLLIDLPYVSRRPPGKALRQEFTMISRLTSMPITQQIPQPLFMEGRFFLQAVAAALNHLVASPTPTGTWIRGRRGMPPGLVPKSMSSHRDDDGLGQTPPFSSTWIDELRFFPNAMISNPRFAWKAVFFDLSTQTFFCQNALNPDHWLGWNAPRPVHRYFDDLVFTNRVQTWIFDQSRITFPDVILSTSS